MRWATMGGMARGRRVARKQMPAWLVGLMDERVVGMIPIVINVLDVNGTTKHHWMTMGYFSPALGDYVNHKLIPYEIGGARLEAVNAIEDPLKAGDLARRAAEEGWSVREVERRSAARKGAPRNGKRNEVTAADPVLRALEEALREHLSTRVNLRGGSKGKGSIEIPFDSTQEFERVFALITGREASEVVA